MNYYGTTIAEIKIKNQDYLRYKPNSQEMKNIDGIFPIKNMAKILRLEVKKYKNLSL